MTNPTAPLLSESEVQAAESRYETAKTKYLAITEGTEWWKHMETPTGVIGQSLTDIPALVRDWRALKARVEKQDAIISAYENQDEEALAEAENL